MRESRRREAGGEGWKEGEKEEEGERGRGRGRRKNGRKKERREEARRNRADCAPLTQHTKTPNTVREPRAVGCIYRTVGVQ